VNSEPVNAYVILLIIYLPIGKVFAFLPEDRGPKEKE